MGPTVFLIPTTVVYVPMISRYIVSSNVNFYTINYTDSQLNRKIGP